jgi:hypothetical protein
MSGSIVEQVGMPLPLDRFSGVFYRFVSPTPLDRHPGAVTEKVSRDGTQPSGFARNGKPFASVHRSDIVDRSGMIGPTETESEFAVL